MTKEDIKKIKDFIKNNGITFEHGSRNTHSTIISGYSLSLPSTSKSGLVKILLEECPNIKGYPKEFNNVFEFAKRNNYERYWDTVDAKERYKF